jgi:hypothetical protein
MTDQARKIERDKEAMRRAARSEPFRLIGPTLIREHEIKHPAVAPAY